jgi:hypothetical protein
LKTRENNNKQQNDTGEANAIRENATGFSLPAVSALQKKENKTGQKMDTNTAMLKHVARPVINYGTQPIQRVTGLASAVDAYAGGWGGLLAGWADQTPQGRANAMLALVNAQLTAVGVPGIISVTLSPASPGFIDETWTVNATQATCELADPAGNPGQRLKVKQLMADMYHEGRHAEQMFRAARLHKIQNAEANRQEIQSRFKMPNAVADAVVANVPGALSEAETQEATTWGGEVRKGAHALNSPADLVEHANTATAMASAGRIFNEFVPRINGAVATMAAQPDPITPENHSAAVDAIVGALTVVKTQFEAMQPMFTTWYERWNAYHQLAIERDAHTVGFAVEAALGLPAVNIAANTVEAAWATLRGVKQRIVALETLGPGKKVSAEINGAASNISGEEGEGLEGRLNGDDLSAGDLDALLLADCDHVQTVDASNWIVFTENGQQCKVHKNAPSEEVDAPWGTYSDYTPEVSLATVRAFVAEAISRPAAFDTAFTDFRTALQSHMNSRNRDIPALPL